MYLHIFYRYKLVPVNQTLIDQMGSVKAAFYQLANDKVSEIYSKI